MEATSTEVQNNFGSYLKYVCFEDVIILKNGKRAAILSKYCEEAGKSGSTEVNNSAVCEKAGAYDANVFKKSGISGISYEDFLHLSESGENRYEYIGGDVYLLSSPVYEHQHIVTEVLNIMYQWFKGMKCRPLTAPFDVTLSGRDKENGKNVVQPDVIVICDTEKINEKGRYTGIPSLAVEVLSEFTRSKDMIRKLDLYAGSGVDEYWIIDPDSRQLLLYFFQKGEVLECRTFRDSDMVASRRFTGLELQLDSIFS